MILDSELLEILAEAVKTRQRKEELERAIGRAVRRNNLDFKIYIRIVDELREVMGRKKISLESAANVCLEEGKNKPNQ